MNNVRSLGSSGVQHISCRALSVCLLYLWTEVYKCHVQFAPFEHYGLLGLQIRHYGQPAGHTCRLVCLVCRREVQLYGKSVSRIYAACPLVVV
jgi:hypothetical protein